MQNFKLPIVILTMSFSLSIFASTLPGECQTALTKARQTLVDLMGGKKDNDQYEAVSNSANAVSTCFDNLQVSGKEKEISELKSIWAQFKATREGELIKAIKAGDNEKAKAIGTGIQAERLNKMKAILAKLKGGDL